MRPSAAAHLAAAPPATRAARDWIGPFFGSIPPAHADNRQGHAAEPDRPRRPPSFRAAWSSSTTGTPPLPDPVHADPERQAGWAWACSAQCTQALPDGCRRRRRSTDVGRESLRRAEDSARQSSTIRRSGRASSHFEEGVLCNVVHSWKSRGRSGRGAVAAPAHRTGARSPESKWRLGMRAG